MGRNAKKRRAERGGGAGKRKNAPAKAAPAAPAVQPVSSGAWAFGIVCLLVAVAASFMLTLDGLGIGSLPGCGPESGCAAAAKSVWGKVPVVNWPTSFVGLAWFAALLTAWIMGRGAAHKTFVTAVFIGVAGSLLLTGVMFTNGYVCNWCLATHGANIAFGIMLFVVGRRAAPMPRQIAVMGAGFLVATVGLGVAQAVTNKAQDDQAREDLRESIERINNDALPANAFTGRYLTGPENAPVRVVIMSDYQCPDCKRVEGEVRGILQTRDDVSFSAKHFPMNTLCNRFCEARNFNPHPNACWAARAAEAAGILGGDEAFFRMHHWLFEREGSFTAAELNAALPELGFDTDEFIETMTGILTEQYVKEDIEEGIQLGLHFTPMVFINGVEVQGWTRPGAVREAIMAVAASAPQPGTATEDVPPTAAEKYVNDWRGERIRMLPQRDADWSRSSEPRGGRAPVKVVIFGDYIEAGTKQLDTRIRNYLPANPEVSYEFRHYPFNQACNPQLPDDRHPHACRLAAAAEAAGELGGADMFWRMHAWLMRQTNPDENTPAVGAAELGLDAVEFAKALASAEVNMRIADDVRAGRSQAIRGIPTIFVNGKWMPRWNLEGADPVGTVLTEAASGGAP